jgi:CheY-like chemotaxis protein
LLLQRERFHLSDDLRAELERERAARALAEEALRTSQESVRLREEMLAVVAHDLRNPLNVIAMAAGTLMMRSPDSTARRPIERIQRSIERAERLIRDLMDVSAIDAGRFSVETETVDTTSLILTALDSQQSLAADASVIIASDLSPDLCPVNGDRERLLQVMENLIGNAVKFTNPGGSVVAGASSPSSEEVLVWVKDNGVGVPDDQIPHIFDRYWQAKKRDRRGTGLGLTICKAIVEAHRGAIWVESQLGAGTKVSFKLPATKPPAGSRPARTVANILLVDDRPENLASLSAILERPDYRLTTATSGEQALSLALRHEFDLALVDIAMPVMNGLEVTMNLKRLGRSRDIPVIFVTAFGDDPEEVHRAYAAGGVDYLVKPLDPEIVRKKVAVFANLSRKRGLDGLNSVG